MTAGSSTPATELLACWLAALPGGAPALISTRAGEDLVARWGEPHRRYHTIDHLTSVLAVVTDFEDQALDPDAVRLAAWYHDAIYDPRRMDNEEASALLAEAQLPGLGVTSARVAEVGRLIRLTATHDPAPGDRNGALLTDADLAILGAEPAGYRAYAWAVRAEYAHVPDAAFTAGRAGVLESLLALPRLFHTSALHDRLEDRARQNLTAELDTLRPPASSP